MCANLPDIDVVATLLGRDTSLLLRRGRTHGVLAMLLLALSSALILLAPLAVPVPAKALWVAGVLVVVGLRTTRPGLTRHVARFGLTAAVLYVGVVFALARIAERELQAELPGALEVHSTPVPAGPFRQRLVARLADGYLVVDTDGNRSRFPLGDADDPRVRRALADPAIRGFANWMRFPQYELERDAAGTLVRINDLRYVEPGGPSRGIGRVEVWLKNVP